jgi:hypothetical protein
VSGSCDGSQNEHHESADEQYRQESAHSFLSVGESAAEYVRRFWPKARRELSPDPSAESLVCSR